MSFAALQTRSDPAAAAAARMGLSLGPKHDAHEQEAERVANNVAHGPAPQNAPAKQSMANVDFARHAGEQAFDLALDPGRRRADPASSIADRQLPMPTAQRRPETVTAAQAVPQAMQPAHVQRPGGGDRLDMDTRHAMEMRFNVSFERVRIHTGRDAALRARALGAAAFTVGTDIFFAENRYAPNSRSGRELLAHELTHVVQQSPALRDAEGQLPGGLHAAPASVQRSVLDWVGEHVPHPVDDLERAVRKLPGYKLAVLIVGKDPFNDQPAPTGATAWIRAFLEFVPGGNDAYTRLEQSGALEDAYNWVRRQLSDLGLSLDSILATLKSGYNSFVEALPHIQDGVARALDVVRPVLYKGAEFIGRVFNKLIELGVEFALKKLGGDEVVRVLRGAADTFFLIARDPVAFLRHLLDAVWKGFGQFSTNIVEHLKHGAMQWLFGSAVPDMQPPPRSFAASELLRVVLEVTGLTWKKIRPKLVKVFGSEEAVAYLERSFEFLIKIRQAGSFAAVWEMILAEARGLIDGVIAQVRDYVTTKIVTAGVEALVKLFSPASALVQAVETIYHVVTFVLAKKQQLVDFVASVTSSVRRIAEGNIVAAADAVEGALEKGIAPALGLLAEQVHLGNIGEKLREIIARLQTTISDAIDRVLEKVAGGARRFYAKGKETLGKVYEWFNMRKDLLIGDEEHAIYMEGTEDDPRLMIASEPQRWSVYLDRKHRVHKHPDIKTAATKARELEKPMPRGMDDKSKAKFVMRKGVLFREMADLIVGMGFTKDADAPPDIHYSEGHMTSDGGAWEMTAIRLRKTGYNKGGAVRDNAPIYARLPKLNKKREKKYVQGHLLNRLLGGHGNRYNLTPLTYSANKLHETRAEKDIKGEIDNGAVMHYKVWAEYGKQKDVIDRIEQIEARQQESGKETPQQKRRLAELRAEQRLATKLNFEAFCMNYKPGKGYVRGKLFVRDHVDQQIDPDA